MLALFVIVPALGVILSAAKDLASLNVTPYKI
jgi:hypothetical protein